jgi:hypothetical protein
MLLIMKDYDENNLQVDRRTVDQLGVTGQEILNYRRKLFNVYLQEIEGLPYTTSY